MITPSVENVIFGVEEQQQQWRKLGMNPLEIILRALEELKVLANLPLDF